MTAALPRDPPKYLSPSSSKTLRECPRRFEYTKVFGWREPPGRAAVLGQVIHKCWELLSGCPKGLRVQRTALRMLDEVWAAIAPVPIAVEPAYLVPSDEDVVDLVRDFGLLGLDDDDAVRFYRQAAEALAYIVEQEPVISGEAVVHRELPLDCKVGDVPFKGRVDRIDSHPDGLEVLDLKTGKAPMFDDGRVRHDRLADMADQVLLYAPAVETTTAISVVAVSLYFVGESGRSWVPVDISGVPGAVKRLEEAWDDFQRWEQARSYPARPTKLCCWCPHFENCPEGSSMIYALRPWMADWERANGRPTPARATINGWPMLRREQWIQSALDSWPLLQAALA